MPVVMVVVPPLPVAASGQGRGTTGGAHFGPENGPIPKENHQRAIRAEEALRQIAKSYEDTALQILELEQAVNDSKKENGESFQTRNFKP